MRALLLAVATLALTAAPARGQVLFERSFSTQLYEPAFGTEPLLTLEPASVAGHLEFGLAMLLNYQHRPLVLATQPLDSSGAPVGEPADVAVVRNQMTMNLVGAMGLHHKWLHAEIGLDLPINMVTSGNAFTVAGEEGESLSGASAGDLRLQLKVLLLRDWKRWSLAFAPTLTFPTSCASSGLSACDEEGHFGGDHNLTFRPRFVADYRRDKWLLAFNLGWLFRQNSWAASSRVGDQLLYGLGAGYQLHRRVQAVAELVGRAGFSHRKSCRSVGGGVELCDESSGPNQDNFPLELGLGSNIALPHGMSLTGGLGFGLVRAVGAPTFRLIAGLRWVPDFEDTDHDGTYDRSDRCPTQAEDRDGYQDDDGCPDLDNDGDLIPDTRDKCPNQAEDADTYQDGDGCPEADNDGDGVPDLKDACPMKPETKNGFRDEDGCPDIPDKDDDGIENSKDRCPDKPETINGFEDADGCPDQGKVSVSGKRIWLSEQLRFAGKRVHKKSHEALNQLAEMLKNRPDIKRLRIEGHTRERVTAKYRLMRWQRRADAVLAYLVERGVAAERLSAVALGGDQPLEGDLAQTGGIAFIIDGPPPQPSDAAPSDPPPSDPPPSDATPSDAPASGK